MLNPLSLLFVIQSHSRTIFFLWQGHITRVDPLWLLYFQREKRGVWPRDHIHIHTRGVRPRDHIHIHKHIHIHIHIRECKPGHGRVAEQACMCTVMSRVCSWVCGWTNQRCHSQVSNHKDPVPICFLQSGEEINFFFNNNKRKKNTKERGGSPKIDPRYLF